MLKKTSFLLLPLINNEQYNERAALVTYYNPMWGKNNPDIISGIYSQDKKYKLYKNGNFYNYSVDVYENHPLNIKTLSKTENKVYLLLKKSLDTIPDLPSFNHNNWVERGLKVRQSGKFSNTWKLNIK